MQPPGVKHNHPLRELNSFGLDITAETYFHLNQSANIEPAVGLLQQSHHRLILGGGSNILFLGNFHGSVVHVDLRGREVVGRDSDHLLLKLGAGENWHDTVQFCVANRWGGIENLSLIPGTVGAAPIQNIGAYGAELKDVFHELEAIDLDRGTSLLLSEQDCQFGYRDSVFKQAGGRYLILSVTLKLALHPVANLTHAALYQQLEDMHLRAPTIADISAAVIAIRSRKLPDPAVLGNAGSFFKNPVIPLESYRSLQDRLGDLPGYPVPGAGVKIPAGWLIEQTGWKEKCSGRPCGVHDSQALVLVNHGTATGWDILDLAKDIAKSVEDTFGISLEREVRVVDVAA